MPVSVGLRRFNIPGFCIRRVAAEPLGGLGICKGRGAGRVHRNFRRRQKHFHCLGTIHGLRRFKGSVVVTLHDSQAHGRAYIIKIPIAAVYIAEQNPGAALAIHGNARAHQNNLQRLSPVHRISRLKSPIFIALQNTLIHQTGYGGIMRVGAVHIAEAG